MKISQIDIKLLVPYKNNPRNNAAAVEFVKNSIREFGFKVPLVIDPDYTIVAGHTRYLAAQELGIEQLPCIIADDLTADQIKAFRIADNSTSSIAEWDYDLLTRELASLPDFNFSDFGLEPFDIDLEEELIEDEPPVLSEAEPASKIGDIWQLGRHRLICGDTTDSTTIKRLLDGAVPDLVQTDPPYNVDYGSKAESINKYGSGFSNRHIENDSMTNESFIAFLNSSFKNLFEDLKPGGAFYIWHASSTLYEFETALRMNGIQTRQQLIWNKNTIVLGRQDYQWKHEPCLYGWKNGAAHYFIDDRTLRTVFEDKDIDFHKMKKAELLELLEDIFSDKISATILNEDKPTRSEEHPTMKPVKLIARQIKNSTKPGDIVLDGFGGSGTTLITCEQIGRTCYMAEYDPRYVDVIAKRWERLTGEKAILIKQ